MVIRQQKAAKIEFLKKRKQKTVSFNIRDTRLTPLDPFEKKKFFFQDKDDRRGEPNVTFIIFYFTFFSPSCGNRRGFLDTESEKGGKVEVRSGGVEGVSSSESPFNGDYVATK